METTEASFLTMLMDRLSGLEEGVCRLSKDVEVLKPIADLRRSIDEVDIHTLPETRMKAQLFTCLEDICTSECFWVYVSDIAKEVALAVKAKGFRVFHQGGTTSNYVVWCGNKETPDNQCFETAIEGFVEL